ncbi:MAG TPA: glycerophosphodiester phosphodiesterase [Gemmatimonadales bacterium]|jgi:glycerophosphoryl diester phosphodiesterase
MTETPAQFSTPTKALVIGHRGASGHAPENSLAAFRIAANGSHAGVCDGVELDIQTTSDGELVVYHDSVLATGEAIARLPGSRVRATILRDGTPIPTLQEALAVLGGVEVFIEAKHLPATADRSLMATIGAFGGKCHLHAFDHRVVARLRRLDASLSLGILSRSYPVDPVAQVTHAGAGTLWQEAYLIDEALVTTCHAAGIRVIAWTVNNADEADALARIGVDGLCGDWPERLRRHT